MRFLGSSLLIITLLVALVAAPAGAQGYGVKGKSTFQVTDFFVSGGTDLFFQLNYRMNDSYAFVAGFETASAPGVSATAFGASLRYYLPLAEETKAEPYLFGGFCDECNSYSTARGE
jgi:hypothetical protein